MKTCLLLGAFGFLGSSLGPYLEFSGYRILKYGRGDKVNFGLNWERAEQIAKFLVSEKIDFIVNLAAETNVDDCEDHFLRALTANTVFVQRITNAIQLTPENSRPFLIHISTDQVYGGVGPHIENFVNPLNVYAYTKFGGELFASKVSSAVLRTNFIGGSAVAERISFSDWIVNSLRAKREITIFQDVLVNPLHINSLCEAILTVMNRPVNGTYNLSSSGGMSKAEIAQILARLLGFESSLMKVGKLSDVTLRARRPLDMRLNSQKFEKTFNLNLPSLISQIELVAGDY